MILVGQNGTILRWNGVQPTPTPYQTPPPTGTPTDTPLPSPTPTAPTAAPDTPTPETSATPPPTASPGPGLTSTPGVTPTGALTATNTPPPGATATPSPNPSGSPTGTPSPELTLGVRLAAPRTQVHPGDEFWVKGYLDNPGQQTLDHVPVFFILDVQGALYFWPSWGLYDPPAAGVDFERRDLPAGSTEVPVVPAFAWPDTGAGALTGLRFYGAMLNTGMTAILGEFGVLDWSYGP
jgi:hypothetical protein